MKIAIISDIHSNLEALNTALEYIEFKEQVRQIICLGDIVGYGADPNACLNRITKLTDKICMGNHDYAVFHPKLENVMNRMAKYSIQWTREIAGGELKKKEKLFKEKIEEDDIIYVHSNPISPLSWDYIYSFQADYYFEKMKHKLCFIGHTHTPSVYTENKNIKKENDYYVIDKGIKTIVNVGSIGQPRDGDNRLCFVIFDNNNWKLKFVRLNYNIERARKKIIKSGLPKELGDRLIAGF